MNASKVHHISYCHLSGCTCGKPYIMVVGTDVHCGHCRDLLFGDHTTDLDVTCVDGVLHWTHRPTEALVHRCGVHDSAAMWDALLIADEVSA